MTQDRETALAALGPQRCSDYESWLSVGMALHAVDPSPAMLAEWDRWSQNCSEKYEPGVCLRRWASFNADGGISIGSLIHMADEDSPGWRSSRSKQRSRSETDIPDEVLLTQIGVQKSERARGSTNTIENCDKTVVVLPGGSKSINQPAGQLGELIAATGRFYCRGEAIAKLAKDDEGRPVLRTVKCSGFPSIFESVADLYKLRNRKDFESRIKTTCSKQAAELIVHADSFLDAIPPIKLLSKCPILSDQNGQLVQVVGYDRKAAVYAFGQRAPDLSLDEARSMLFRIVKDFRFATLSDRSRALAAIITPALLHAGLLCGRSPVDLGEADRSQSGKGYRNKITAAVYNDIVRPVVQRKRGVGGLEETFNALLIAGASTLSFDNVRGRIDSPAIESFLTEDVYLAREPFSRNVEIDPRRIVVMMTSNKAEFTADFGNRCSCTRILKQSADYRYCTHYEGTILDHVRANQPKFLGAVFAIIRKWFRRGMPKTTETRHDFRIWAQSLDWIVQNLLDQAPLLDGHAETIVRATKPVLNWLRDVALAITAAGQIGRWLRANQILDIIADVPDVEIPGISNDANTEDDKIRDVALKAIGRKIAACFQEERVDIGEFTVARKETSDSESRTRNEYLFATRCS